MGRTSDADQRLKQAALEKLWTDEWQPNLDRAFSSSIEPLARFTGYFDTIYQSQLETKKKYGKVLGCAVCAVGSEVSTQEVDVAGAVRAMMAKKLKYYESSIRDAVAQGVIEPCDPTQEALALLGLLQGLISQARIMNDPEILRRLPDMAFGLLRVKSKGVPQLIAQH